MTTVRNDLFPQTGGPTSLPVGHARTGRRRNPRRDEETEVDPRKGAGERAIGTDDTRPSGKQQT